jgi:small subunit ribosomal protein S3
MGQKIHPLGFRLGVTKKHKSQWFAKTNKYPQLVVEDHFLRKILIEKFFDAGIESIEIQRKLNQIKIEIRAARTGILIGRDRKNLESIRKLLESKLKLYRLKNFNVLNVATFSQFQLQSKLACSKNIGNSNSPFILQPSKINKNTKLSVNTQPQLPININSVKIAIHVIKLSNPDTKANFVADFLVEQLEKRGSFRLAMRQAVRRCQRAGVKGLKIQIAGRLNGAEIARTEWIREGRVPLQTLRSDIDYSYKIAKTIYGILGIKVWVFNGEINV